MRLELDALPKAVSGKADQNKAADDHQTLQHGYWASPSMVGSNQEEQKQPRGEAAVKVPNDAMTAPSKYPIKASP
jgi:hypothetical protein